MKSGRMDSNRGTKKNAVENALHLVSLGQFESGWYCKTDTSNLNRKNSFSSILVLGNQAAIGSRNRFGA
jgi:hypothetical protein